MLSEWRAGRGEGDDPLRVWQAYILPIILKIWSVRERMPWTPLTRSTTILHKDTQLRYLLPLPDLGGVGYPPPLRSRKFSDLFAVIWK